MRKNSRGKNKNKGIHIRRKARRKSRGGGRKMSRGKYRKQEEEEISSCRNKWNGI